MTRHPCCLLFPFKLPTHKRASSRVHTALEVPFRPVLQYSSTWCSYTYCSQMYCMWYDKGVMMTPSVKLEFSLKTLFVSRRYFMLINCRGVAFLNTFSLLSSLSTIQSDVDHLVTPREFKITIFINYGRYLTESVFFLLPDLQMSALFCVPNKKIPALHTLT